MQWKAAFIVIGVLLHCRVKSTCDSSCFSVSLTVRKAVFVVEKRVDSLQDLRQGRAGPWPVSFAARPGVAGRAGPPFRAWPVKHGPGRAGPSAWPRPAGPSQETGQGRGLRSAFLVSEDPNFTVTVRSSPLPLYSACVVDSDKYLFSLSLS